MKYPIECIADDENKPSWYMTNNGRYVMWFDSQGVPGKVCVTGAGHSMIYVRDHLEAMAQAVTWLDALESGG